MFNAFVVFMFLFSIACTKSSPPADATSDAAKPDQQMPTLQIEPSDRSCTQDSDCELIATQCSCSCGEGVNKNHAHKYAGKLEKLCKSYQGKVCKVLCNGTVKCQERLCTYVQK